MEDIVTNTAFAGMKVVVGERRGERRKLNRSRSY